jgi:hypothetical protein
MKSTSAQAVRRRQKYASDPKYRAARKAYNRTHQSSLARKRVIQKRWREENYERYRAIENAWKRERSATSPEFRRKACERTAAWVLANPEKKKSQDKDWARRNRTRAREIKAAWKDRNPDAVRNEWVRSNITSKAIRAAMKQMGIAPIKNQALLKRCFKEMGLLA